jgi:nucleoside-specific outer membrane channel protein Tsx
MIAEQNEREGCVVSTTCSVLGISKKWNKSLNMLGSVHRVKQVLNGDQSQKNTVAKWSQFRFYFIRDKISVNYSASENAAQDCL